MLHRAKVAVCSEISSEHVKTLCGNRVKFLNVKNLEVTARLLEAVTSWESGCFEVLTAVFNKTESLLGCRGVLTSSLLTGLHYPVRLRSSNGERMWLEQRNRSGEFPLLLPLNFVIPKSWCCLTNTCTVEFMTASKTLINVPTISNASTFQTTHTSGLKSCELLKQ